VSRVPTPQPGWMLFTHAVRIESICPLDDAVGAAL
jgi:hypothetical protein